MSYSQFASPSSAGDKRQGERPVPFNLSDYLNPDQMHAVKQMEQFGWRLSFVRRHEPDSVLAVVSNSEETLFGKLEADGSINTHVDLKMRSH